LFQRYSLFKPVVIRPTYCDKESEHVPGEERTLCLCTGIQLYLNFIFYITPKSFTTLSFSKNLRISICGSHENIIACLLETGSEHYRLCLLPTQCCCSDAV